MALEVQSRSEDDRHALGARLAAEGGTDRFEQVGVHEAASAAAVGNQVAGSEEPRPA